MLTADWSFLNTHWYRQALRQQPASFFPCV